MGLEQEKYPYPGYQKYYQMTNGVNNTKTTKTAHDKYYTTEEVDNIIKDVVSKVVTNKGVVVESCKFSDLPNPTQDNVGIIYNVTDEFTTDNRFIDGANKTYPGGTNVICMANNGSYIYDVMMGEIGAVDQSGIQDIIDSL